MRGSMRGLTMAAAVTMLFVACTSNGGPEEGPEFSPSIPPSASPSPTKEKPVPEAVEVSTGSATVEVSGGVKAKLQLPLGPNGEYQPSPGQFSLSYLSREGNALILGGDTPAGTQRTTSDLTLSIVVQGKSARTFPSARGECSITVTKSSRTQFAGRFSCRNLRGQGKTIKAAGTFSAAK